MGALTMGMASVDLPSDRPIQYRSYGSTAITRRPYRRLIASPEDDDDARTAESRSPASVESYQGCRSRQDEDDRTREPPSPPPRLLDGDQQSNI
uniref:Uncharacterized protein n=1 Tax=Plectus sambesii TaxID=2011161 RepID=A0A914WIB9_9BILA